MSIQVTPIPRLTVLTTPAFTLGTVNTAGSAITGVASDSTLLTFDGTLPDAITFGQSGATGSATVASRRDHSHAMASQTRAQVAVGSYTGDGSSDLAVTGVGFEPSAIWIAFRQTSNTGNTNIVYCTPQILDNQTEAGIFHKGGGGHATYSGLVVSFDDDGFSVNGGTNDPNTDGAIYDYLAIG
jgi:hypothetical protein